MRVDGIVYGSVVNTSIPIPQEVRAEIIKNADDLVSRAREGYQRHANAWIENERAKLRSGKLNETEFELRRKTIQNLTNNRLRVISSNAEKDRWAVKD